MNKKSIFIIIMLILIVTINSVSMATTTNNILNEGVEVKTKIESDKTQITEEEEVNLTFKLEIKDKRQENINAYKAKIEYDNNIFEKITQDNFIMCNSWTNIQYNSENGEFIVINFNDTKKKMLLRSN